MSSIDRSVPTASSIDDQFGINDDRSFSTTHDDARATDRSTRHAHVFRAFIDDRDDDDDDDDDDARDDDDGAQSKSKSSSSWTREPPRARVERDGR